MSSTIGKVRWFSTPLGYGFIERDDGSTYYMHYTDVDRREEDPVRSGERVEFDVAESPRGPRAVHVTRT